MKTSGSILHVRQQLPAWLFACGLSASGIAAAMWTMDRVSYGPDLWVTLGFAAAFFAARLLTMRLPQGDEVCVTMVAGLVGLALVDAVPLVAAAVSAGLADALARSPQRHHRAWLQVRLLDTMRNASVIAILSPWQVVLRPTAASQVDDRLILWVIAAGASFALLDWFTLAVQQTFLGGGTILVGMAGLLRQLTPVYVVHAAMSAVVVRLSGVSGLWPIPVALLLTLILQNSFNLYMRIRRAYSETISALARAAELDRPQDAGHARRVADLAVQVGRHLGLSGRELEKVGYAALLHDIGRIGSSPGESASDQARRGAEIVGAIPFLEGVERYIYWSDGQGPGDRPLGEVIVRVCSGFDRMRLEHGIEAALAAVDVQESEDHGRVRTALARVVQSRTQGPARPRW